jgi:hypothetical protein
MERLTEMMMGKAVLPMIPMDIKDHKDLNQFHAIRRWYEDRVIKLAEYEDTGLEPTECASKWDLENECNLRDSEITSLREQLEDYIDTGLTPEEISHLKDNANEWRDAYIKMKEQWKHDCDLLVKCGNELADYRLAEEQGLLIKFPPCEPGDIIYEIDAPEYGLIICEVVRVYHAKSWICGVKTNGKFSETYIDVNVIGGHGKGSSYSFESKDVNKSVFLTREAAEQALKGGGAE